MQQSTIDIHAEHIGHAIAGHGVDRPVSVADIVEDIDWSQRTGSPGSSGSSLAGV